MLSWDLIIFQWPCKSTKRPALPYLH